MGVTSGVARYQRHFVCFFLPVPFMPSTDRSLCLSVVLGCGLEQQRGTPRSGWLSSWEL